MVEGWKKIQLAAHSILKARIGWQGLKKAEYLASGYAKLITGTDFLNGYVCWKNCAYVSKERYEMDRNIQVKNDDILLTKDGTVGKVCFVSDLKGYATLNSGIFVIRPLNNVYDSKFMFYVFTSHIFLKFLVSITAGSTIVHLYQKDFVKFSVLIPGKVSEQRCIATALSDMDALIADLEKLIAKKKAILKGTMQELLTGRNKRSKKLPISDMGIKILRGDIITEGSAKQGDIPVIAAGITPAFYCDRYNYDGKLITISASGANAGYIGYHVGKIYASDCSVITEQKDCNLKYLYFLLKENQNQIFELQSGGAQPHVHPKDIAVLEVFYMKDVFEQNKIAGILGSLESGIIEFERKLEKYKKIKAGMMHELLTGHIRLLEE